MTDPTNPDDTVDETGEADRPAAPRTAAAAARRARRIGGRVPGAAVPGTSDGASDGASDETTGEVEKPEKLRKADKKRKSADTVDLAKDESGEAAPPSAWVTWLPAGVLGVGALIMAVLLLLFSHGVWWGPTPPAQNTANVQKAREQVLAAATSCVVTFYQYSYKDIPGYEKKALACTSGALTDQLKKAIETQVGPVATKLKSVQNAQINNVGIESVTPDGQWVVLAFGQLSVTNTNVPSGRTDPFAAELRVQQVGGKWVLVNIQSIGTPVNS